MNLRKKYMTKVILAISLILLIGGIIGSIYCAHKINERLNWAESIGDPEYTKQYNYRVVAHEVKLLGVWLTLSADMAIIGGLTSLALVFRGRFREGLKGLAFSLPGFFIMLLLILGAIFLLEFLIQAVGGLVGALITILLFLAIVLMIKRLRLRVRDSFFTLGGFLMVIGVSIAITFFIAGMLEVTQEFQIMFGVMGMVGIGVAIVGIFISLVAICWPKKKADELKDAV